MSESLNCWVQIFGSVNFWIQMFGSPVSRVHMTGSPVSWSQMFEVETLKFKCLDVQTPEFWKSNRWKLGSQKLLNFIVWKSKPLNSKVWKSKLLNSYLWKSKLFNSNFCKSKLMNSNVWNSIFSNSTVWKSSWGLSVMLHSHYGYCIVPTDKLTNVLRIFQSSHLASRHINHSVMYISGSTWWTRWKIIWKYIPMFHELNTLARAQLH